MENASKALTIAAGVLIAIMIISMIMLFVNNISETNRINELKVIAKQTTEFNKAYEVYDKKLMRGTELITLINKVRSYNNTLDELDKEHLINVVFTLRTGIYSVKIQVKNGNETKSKQEVLLEENKKYELLNNGEKARLDANLEYILELASAKTTSDGGQIVEYIDEYNFTKVYDSFNTFKRKFFTCKKIEYNVEGRVCLLEFDELKQSDDLEGYN